MKTVMTWLAAALTLVLAWPAAAQEIATIAAQPDVATLEQWKADGVTTVINMRPDGEMAGLNYDEKAAVEALGMTYVSIPFAAADASPDVVAALAAALDGAEGPVALHCRSGSRAANALAALQVEQGVADPAALQSPAPDLALIPSMMRSLSPRYAEAMSRADCGDAATC